MQHKIYIPSKGRPESRTAKSLTDQNIPFKIFVESQDYKDYVSNWGEDSVIDLGGNDYGCASYSRSAIKKYSIDQGEDWHWQLDDDISKHYEVIDGKNVKKPTDEIFTKVEEFKNQYTNIGIIGLSSSAFNKLSGKDYSVNAFAFGNVLVNNHTDCWWEMNTVEDLDYTLQCLTKNLCTVRFFKYAFDLVSTGYNKGGYHEIDNVEANDGIFVRDKRIYNTVDRWPGIIDGVVSKKHKIKGYDKRVKTENIWRKFKHPLIPKNPENSLWDIDN